MSTRPSIAIVGLLPRQAERVKADYGEQADLLFFDTCVSTKRLSASVESTDQVILMTKFMSHQVQNALRSHQGLVYCNGGTSAVGMALEDLLDL